MKSFYTYITEVKQYLLEGRPFVAANGDIYIAARGGRYSKNGEPITKEEYDKAVHSPKEPKKRGRKKKTDDVQDSIPASIPAFVLNKELPLDEQLSSLFGDDFKLKAIQEEFDPDTYRELIEGFSIVRNVCPELMKHIKYVGGRLYDYERSGDIISKAILEINEELTQRQNEFDAKFKNYSLDQMKDKCIDSLSSYYAQNAIKTYADAISVCIGCQANEFRKTILYCSFNDNKLQVLLKKYGFDKAEKLLLPTKEDGNYDISKIDKKIYAFCLEYDLLRQRKRIDSLKKALEMHLEKFKGSEEEIDKKFRTRLNPNVVAYCNGFYADKNSKEYRSQIVVLRKASIYEHSYNKEGWGSVANQFENDSRIKESLADTILHETGHALSNLLDISSSLNFIHYANSSASGQYYTPAYYATDEIKDIYRIYKKLQLRMLNDYGSTTNPVSIYGGSNMEEMIAESWAHFLRYRGKSKPYVKMIISDILKIANDKGIQLNIDESECKVTEKELKAFDNYERLNVKRNSIEYSIEIDAGHPSTLLPVSYQIPRDFPICYYKDNELVYGKREDVITEIRKSLHARAKSYDRYAKREKVLNTEDYLEYLGSEDLNKFNNALNNPDELDKLIIEYSDKYVELTKPAIEKSKLTFNLIFGIKYRSKEEIDTERKRAEKTKRRKLLDAFESKMKKIYPNNWDMAVVNSLIDANIFDKDFEYKPLSEIKKFFKELDIDDFMRQVEEEKTYESLYLTKNADYLNRFYDLMDKYDSTSDEYFFLDKAKSLFNQQMMNTRTKKKTIEIIDKIANMTEEEIMQYAKDYLEGK